jgi:hypothetical protein
MGKGDNDEMGGESEEEGEELGDGGEGEGSSRMAVEKEQEEHRVVCHEAREKRDPQPRRPRRRNAGRRDETHQKSHPEKYAADMPQEPNDDSPYAHYYT